MTRATDHTEESVIDSNHLERRLAQHGAAKASRYTRGRLPVVLVWSCEIEAWGDALREEIRIKALSRTRKEELIGRS